MNIDVTTSDEAALKVVMFNVAGQAIVPNFASQDLNSGLTTVSVNLDDVPAGSYVLRIAADR